MYVSNQLFCAFYLLAYLCYFLKFNLITKEASCSSVLQVVGHISSDSN